MKTIFYISCLIALLFSASSCNDDFLSKNKKNLFICSDTLYVNINADKVVTSVDLPLNEDTGYRIYMQPKWFAFDAVHGVVKDGIVSFSFTIVRKDLPSYQLSSGNLIIDVDGIGLVYIAISYLGNGSNGGNPRLQCNVSSLIFESVSTLNFTIKNSGQSLLTWSITGAPTWLTLSETSGALSESESTTITASVNLTQFTPGQVLSVTIQINSNAGTGYLIPVRAVVPAIVPPPVDTTLIKTIRITGIVTDAEYNHETGIMALCTKSPNSLILYNSGTNIFTTLPLTRTPNCINISEDGSKAVIGYTVASLSYVDIPTLSVTNEYSIDVIPYDIVLGENGWCYIAADEDQWIAFRSLNLSSGQLISGKNMSTMYEKTILRKIHGKPYLVGTRMALSPTGVLIFDISKGIASDTISYYHESIGRFFVSNDGTKLYASSKNVYTLPAYDYNFHSFAPPVWGKIESSLNYLSIFDECQATSSIFVSGYDGYYYSQGYSSQIEQFNTTNLNKVKTYSTAKVYRTENGISTAYDTDARFIFVNKGGSDLYVIKNLKASYNKDYWTIEVIKTGN